MTNPLSRLLYTIHIGRSVNHSDGRQNSTARLRQRLHTRILETKTRRYWTKIRSMNFHKIGTYSSLINACFAGFIQHWQGIIFWCWISLWLHFSSWSAWAVHPQQTALAAPPIFFALVTPQVQWLSVILTRQNLIHFVIWPPYSVGINYLQMVTIYCLHKKYLYIEYPLFHDGATRVLTRSSFI